MSIDRKKKDISTHLPRAFDFFGSEADRTNTLTMNSDDGLLKDNPERGMKKSHIAIIAAVFVVVIIVIAVSVGVVLSKKKKDETSGAVKISYKPFPAAKYAKAAVATDSEICSKVGRDILKKNGSAMDAAVASAFCTGVVNLHSTGIGGGGFLVYYNRKTKTSEVYDFRETAPGGASEKMFVPNNVSSTIGGMAIAVPGEVSGFHKIWKKYGKLPWAALVEPSIKLARYGFPLPPPVEGAMKRSEAKIRADPGLSEILLVGGKLKKQGDNLTNPQLANTLERIKNNVTEFYHGALAQEIVDDIKAKKGIITLQDLANYNVSVKTPLKTNFKGLEMHTMPPPGSGAVLAMAINIMEGFGILNSDLYISDKATQVFHKIVESFKWGYARRALLGDPDFVPADNITRVVNGQLLNKTYAEIIRKTKIKPDKTFEPKYYGGYYGKEDFGTSHVSILAENGDAVSVTGTVNYLFGGGYRSTKTGIIYNNEMDDFSTPGKSNLYGYPPTPANYIRPGKRPLSSMCPTVITDKNGDVKMVAGASGGSRIITGTAQVIMNKILFGVKLGPSVANPRLHHQLVPNKIRINTQYPLPESIVDGLKKIGHEIEKSTSFSVIQAIYRENANTIYAVSDPRKKGKPAGY